MKRPDKASSRVRIALKSELHKRQKEGTVTLYCEAVNYFLETYATDDVIAEADDDMMRFTQPSNKSPTEYTEALWNKGFKRDRVYDEHVHKDIILKVCWNICAMVWVHIRAVTRKLQYMIWCTMSLR